ncbi:hypothetical protein GCM10023334_099860 [Nonomuraea thailandensis]
MPRWLKVATAAVVPSLAGGMAWWTCAAGGLGLDVTSIVVGLVVLLPGTPLAIWAGQADRRARPLPAPKGDPRPVPAVIGEVPREPKAFQPRSELGERVHQVFAARHVAAAWLPNSGYAAMPTTRRPWRAKSEAGSRSGVSRTWSWPTTRRIPTCSRRCSPRTAGHAY